MFLQDFGVARFGSTFVNSFGTQEILIFANGQVLLVQEWSGVQGWNWAEHKLEKFMNGIRIAR